ncbi:MAG TPA: DUF6506 family protein [Bacillota bacterium]|nr:DUF6506 family protein [Bacillota bacterium]
MTLNAVFMFVAPEADTEKHRTVVETPGVRLTVVGVNNYLEAEKVAKELTDQGATIIELCAGFGNEGVAVVNNAVKNKAVVGVVRFDRHPGLGFKSGDDIPSFL